MPSKKFVLLKAFVPVIKGKLVEKDTGMGGIKLIYQEINDSLTNKKKIERFYLKPFKQCLALDKKECEDTYGKGSWGNTMSPLSNVWLEITSGNYTNFEREFYGIRHITIKDSEIISFLNKQEKEFEIGENQRVIVKISLLDKAKLFIKDLRNW